MAKFSEPKAPLCKECNRPMTVYRGFGRVEFYCSRKCAHKKIIAEQIVDMKQKWICDELDRIQERSRL